MEATTSQVEPAAISAEEVAIVREAAEHCANSLPHDKTFLHDLALKWRALVPSNLPHYASAGPRLVETYVQMYPSLEASGGIDGWAGSESKTVLAALVAIFPTEDERWSAVREALEVAQWNMGQYDR